MEKSKSNKEQLNIAMLGHKMVPSRAGGVELVLTTLSPILVKKGMKVTCYNRTGVLADKEFYEGYTVDEYKGVTLKKAATLHIKGLSAVTSSFVSSVKVAFGKYDIVHYHAEGPAAMMWIPKLFRKKCIVTVHGLDWQREKWQKGLGRWYIKRGEKSLVKHADEIIVLSENVKNYFRNQYGRETVFIPNGVKKPVVRQASDIKALYGIDKDDYFVSVCRLTEEKGIHYLIEAYKSIDTDKKLVIVGDSSDTNSYVEKIKKMAEGNPNIIFTGYATGSLLDELFSNAYAYVLPSNIEGMPLSLLEAMSYGNAVLVSDIHENTAVVENMGLTFKKGSVEDLAGKLMYLEQHPEAVQELKSKSADYILNKYNWDDVADQTIKVYKGILDKDKKR